MIKEKLDKDDLQYRLYDYLLLKTNAMIGYLIEDEARFKVKGANIDRLKENKISLINKISDILYEEIIKE